jgi:hypothetical protein
VSARRVLIAALAESDCIPALGDVDRATQLVDAYRTEVLREAADRLDGSKVLRDLTDDHMHDVNAAANELRRIADGSAS